MALVATCVTRPVAAEPADVFTVAAPVAGAAAPKETPLQDGDASVATQTGALQYSYPIEVPPGRNGMQPHLALSYSSQAPLYGGLASGWSLAIPTITEDTSNGRLWSIATPGKNYQSSMAGGRPLVQVAEPTSAGMIAYRAQNDTTFTRYERANAGGAFWWRAYASDGTVYYFGDTDGAHQGTCTIVSDEYAPLTRTVDPFGNQVDYSYEAGVAGECRIREVTWGKNTAAHQDVFAHLQFSYAAPSPACAGVPVGSQTSYRTGTKIVTGASRLDTITATATIGGSTVHTRVVALTYDAADANCSTTHSAYRTLSSIQEKAWGTSAPVVTLPPVTFGYASGTLSYPSESPAGTGMWNHPELPNNHPFNLGWGRRYNGARWPTVEEMMIDIDGDGLVDRVTSQPVRDSNGHIVACRAVWAKNNGAFGTVVQPTPINLPTLKWSTAPGAPNAYVGGAYANANPVAIQSSAWENCSLNYQATGYTNSSTNGIGYCGGNTSATCPASGVCANHDDCWTGSPSGAWANPPAQTYLSYRWFDADGDGLVDLVASPSGSLSRYNLQHGSDLVSPTEPSLFGAFPACPAGSYAANPQPGSTYTMCGGMVPWFIYKNHGNGQFGIPPTGTQTFPRPDSIQYQPITLESSSGDSAMGGSPVGETQGSFDLDGDGYVDAIAQRQGSAVWDAFRGDATGGAKATPLNTSFPFATTSSNMLGKSEELVTTHFQPFQIQGMIDVNGDGLPDHWSSASPSSTTSTVELNDGTKFRSTGGVGELALSLRPGSDSSLPNVWNTTGSQGLGGTYMSQASRFDQSRAIDLDGDGRVDLAQAPQGTLPFSAYFNQGGAFSGSYQISSGSFADPDAVAHTIVVTDQYDGPDPYDYTWEIRSDVIDLDGDGLPEGVNFGSDLAPHAMYLSKPSFAQPPRLMTSIENHRGAKTTVEYASMNSSNVVQDAASGKASPHSQWVVKRLVTVDSAALPVTTTAVNYKYVSPHYGPVTGAVMGSGNALGKVALRGFEEVDITKQSGAKTVERYDYGMDPSGRLHTTAIYSAETPPAPYTVDDTQWSSYSLFGGAITAYLSTSHVHSVCQAAQTEVTCRTAPAGWSSTWQTPTALSSTTDPGGPALLYQVLSSFDQTDSTPTRQTVATFALNANAATYRLRPLTTTKSWQSGAQWLVFGKSAQTWDSTYVVPLTSETWVDGVDANRSITRMDYDMATGNVVHRWKPIQNAANTTRTTYAYDDQAHFPASETNELGFETDYTYEPGTGTKLIAIGPNVSGCAQNVPSTCPAGAPLKEQHEVHVDGLGRPLDRWETFSDDGSIYKYYQVEQTSYDDSSWASLVATSVTHQQAFDVTNGGVFRWAKDKTSIDGTGRPLAHTAYAAGSAPTDAVTSYKYRDDGTLASVTVPDPTDSTTCLGGSSSGCSVTYNYTFDSLGRATGMRRPDSATQASGVDIAYSGMSVSTTEVVGAAGGVAASKRSISDALGRIIEVDEQKTAGGAWIATKYAYTPDNNVRTITDPENNVTTLTHDWAGHRTAIARQSRSWTFQYDKNGNVTSQLAPGWINLAAQPRYLTTMAYDDLDRVTSRSIGQRELSAADQALFATGTETYVWDYGNDHTGRMRYWNSYAPGSSTRAILVDVSTINAQGQSGVTKETLTIAGYTNLMRQIGRTYYLSGALRKTSYYDTLGGSNQTSSVINLDAIGRPASVLLSQTGLADQTLAVQTRNSAGLVKQRHTDVTGQPMTFVESNWTYDALGRVKSQAIQEGPSATQVARQDVAYFGNDDPSQLDHYLGASNHKQFHYSYDARHQLTGVTESAAGGAFAATYTYGNAGRFSTALETAAALPGSEVKPRNVTYQYSATDPEEVTALVSGSTTYATYAYDAAGNQTSRVLANGDRWDYVYDGKDQLRRATRKNAGGTVQGSEEYWYDGNGQRIATVQRDASGARTELIWTLGDVEAHYDGTGTLEHIYSHVSLGTPVARIDRTANATTTVEYQFHGLADSTLAAVDQSGTINASFDYAPFGELIESTNAGGATAGVAAHRRRLNDKYVDELTDLSYYGARYYDKTLMGWTQGDPLFRIVPDLAKGNPRRANLYQFSLSNSLRYIDPDGRNSAPGTDPGTEPGGIPGWGDGVDGTPGICPPQAVCEDGKKKADSNYDETPVGGVTVRRYNKSMGAWTSMSANIDVDLSTNTVTISPSNFNNAATVVVGSAIGAGLAIRAGIAIAKSIGVAESFLLVGTGMWFSTDGDVGMVANAIEKAHPGRVRGVNRILLGEDGLTKTDLDIDLGDASVQIKTLAGLGLTGQVLKTQLLTGMPCYGYCAGASKGAIRNAARMGLKITNSLDQLLEWVAPKP